MNKAAAKLLTLELDNLQRGRTAGSIVVVYFVLNVPGAVRHRMPNARNILPRTVNGIAGGQSERNEAQECQAHRQYRSHDVLLFQRGSVS